MHIMSIKSIKGCYFKRRMKKFWFMDWKEKLHKASWNGGMGGSVAQTPLEMIYVIKTNRTCSFT